MPRLIFASLIGFSLGAAGYIIFRFWLLPIRRYQRIKGQIAESLGHHALKLSGGKAFQLSPGQSEIFRKQSVSLTEAYYDDLPQWHRMVLTNRKESPDDASNNLQSLSRIRDPDHARNLIGNVIQKLEISGLNIIAMKMLHMTRTQAEGFYAVHKERPFFCKPDGFHVFGACGGDDS